MPRTETNLRDRARQLRRETTEAEQHLWSILRDRQLERAHFRRQHPIPPYVADFASRSRRLVIELDGDTHAGREAYDAARTAALEQRGYRVLRFSNSDVMTNLDGVTRAILIALGRDPDTPPPPL